MDLTDISYEQASIDLDFANRRIIELTIRLAEGSAELKRLRDEIERANRIRYDAASKTGALVNPTKPAVAAVPVPAPASQLPTRRDSNVSIIQRLRSALGQKKQEKTILWTLDEICGRKPSMTPTVSRSELRNLTLRGWAAPGDLLAPFEWVEIVLTGVSGKVSKRVKTESREDIAAHFGKAHLVQSGFQVIFSLAEFNPGPYSIEIVGLSTDGGGIQAQAGVVTIV